MHEDGEDGEDEAVTASLAWLNHTGVFEGTVALENLADGVLLWSVMHVFAPETWGLPDAEPGSQEAYDGAVGRLTYMAKELDSVVPGLAVAVEAPDMTFLGLLLEGVLLTCVKGSRAHDAVNTILSLDCDSQTVIMGFMQNRQSGCGRVRSEKSMAKKKYDIHEVGDDSDARELYNVLLHLKHTAHAELAGCEKSEEKHRSLSDQVRRARSRGRMEEEAVADARADVSGAKSTAQEQQRTHTATVKLLRKELEEAEKVCEDRSHRERSLQAEMSREEEAMITYEDANKRLEEELHKVSKTIVGASESKEVSDAVHATLTMEQMSCEHLEGKYRKVEERKQEVAGSAVAVWTALSEEEQYEAFAQKQLTYTRELLAYEQRSEIDVQGVFEFTRAELDQQMANGPSQRGAMDPDMLESELQEALQEREELPQSRLQQEYDEYSKYRDRVDKLRQEAAEKGINVSGSVGAAAGAGSAAGGALTDAQQVDLLVMLLTLRERDLGSSRSLLRRREATLEAAEKQLSEAEADAAARRKEVAEETAQLRTALRAAQAAPKELRASAARAEQSSRAVRRRIEELSESLPPEFRNVQARVVPSSAVLPMRTLALPRPAAETTPLADQVAAILAARAPAPSEQEAKRHSATSEAEKEAEAQAQAEDKARRDAEAAKAEVEAEAKLEAKAKMEAEEQAHAEAEAVAEEEVEAEMAAMEEMKAEMRAEAEMKAEQEARDEAEAKAEAAARAAAEKEEEEEEVKAEAEAAARAEAEAQAKLKEEETAAKEEASAGERRQSSKASLPPPLPEERKRRETGGSERSARAVRKRNSASGVPPPEGGAGDAGGDGGGAAASAPNRQTKKRDEATLMRLLWEKARAASELTDVISMQDARLARLRGECEARRALMRAELRVLTGALHEVALRVHQLASRNRVADTRGQHLALPVTGSLRGPTATIAEEEDDESGEEDLPP